MRIPENEPEAEEPDNGGDEKAEYKYQRTTTFTSVGRNPVKTIGIQFSQDTFVRLMPLPKLLDLDESMFLFYLNRSLADKVNSIQIYANEYKLKEIRRDGFRVENDFRGKKGVSLVFSDEELADAWVTLAPPDASTFRIRFSEQTPKRFLSAEEVTSPNQ